MHNNTHHFLVEENNSARKLVAKESKNNPLQQIVSQGRSGPNVAKNEFHKPQLQCWEHKNDFQLDKHWGNATGCWGKEPNHISLPKTNPQLRRMRNDYPHEGKTHHNNSKTNFTHKIPSHLREPQRGWMMKMKTPISPNREGITHNQQNRGGKSSSQASLHEKKWRTWVYGKMACIFGCLLAPKVKTGLPQKWVFPKFEIAAHTLPIPMQ